MSSGTRVCITDVEVEIYSYIIKYILSLSDGHQVVIQIANAHTSTPSVNDYLVNAFDTLFPMCTKSYKLTKENTIEKVSKQ